MPQRFEKQEKDYSLALARAALDHYGLGDARVEFFCNSDNLVFRIVADDAETSKFALRVYRPLGYSTREIEDELRWLAALAHEARLPVPAPVTGISGNLVQSVSLEGLPGWRKCALLHWVEGEFLTGALEPRHLEAVGVFMGRLHTEGTPLARAYDLRRTRRLNHNYLSRLIDAPPRGDVGTDVGTDEFKLVVEAAKFVHSRLDEAEQEELEIGLLHADLHQRNYLFTAGGVAAIDFSECCWGAYLHDIAVTLSDLYIDKSFAELPELREAFLSGYQRVRPLPLGYERHIETFLLARTLQVLEWIFRWSNPAHHAWGPAYVTKALGYIERYQTKEA